MSGELAARHGFQPAVTRHFPGSPLIMPPPKDKKNLTRSPGGELLNALVLQVFKLHTALVAAAPAVIQDERINSPKWQLMGSIRHEGKTAAQLGRELGLTRQVTMWHAQALATDGLVVFDTNPNHLRAHLITLTPEGSKVLDQVTANQIAWINGLARELDAEHLSTTLLTLRALQERLG